MYSKNVNFDKFYTKADVVKQCIDAIEDLDSYSLIVEPSAGDGAFLNHLKDKETLAYDIEPEDSRIEKRDWFEIEKINSSNFIVVGNPPFGIRNALAKSFIRHARDLGATTIAFILPDVFSKLTNQSKTLFPDEWKLIKVVKLPKDSFSVEGEVYHVPCSFYIWSKKDVGVDLREVKQKPSPDFSFLSRGDDNADFTVNGNSFTVKNLYQVSNPKAEHYISANIDREKLIENFELCKEKGYYVPLSAINGGNSWVGQNDILKIYSSAKNDGVF